ncbi:MAG: HD domain-containing protein, partial [Thermomicrobiales bacterium]
MNTDALGLTPETVIRDSLYDLIPLSREAGALLGTSAFLRLDGIQQLGFVSRVWPGAKHTRFEHSLGVMHLMRAALERLIAKGAPISDETARTAIAAALLHDIGHYPFSHAIEELGSPVPTHEQAGRRLIEGDEIAPILRIAWRVDPARVARMVHPGGLPLPPEDELVRGLLSGALDVDKLDYLPRDARACHVPYGGVDTARLLDSLRVIVIDGQPRIGIDDKGVSPLHSLINARQEMFDNVYWHHTNRACMAMLLRAVQEAVVAGLPVDDLTQHDDASLLAALSDPAAPEPTRRLVAGLRDRRLHKRAVEVSARAGDLYRWLSTLFHDPAARRDQEDRMALACANAKTAGVK